MGSTGSIRQAVLAAGARSSALSVAAPVRVHDGGAAAAGGSGRSAHCGAVAGCRRRCLGKPRPCRAPGAILRPPLDDALGTRQSMARRLHVGVRRGRRETRSLRSVFRTRRTRTGEWLASHLARPWHHRHWTRLRPFSTARSHGIRTDDSNRFWPKNTPLRSPTTRDSVRAGRTPTSNHGPRRSTPLMRSAPCATSRNCICALGGRRLLTGRAGGMGRRRVELLLRKRSAAARKRCAGTGCKFDGWGRPCLVGFVDRRATGEFSDGHYRRRSVQPGSRRRRVSARDSRLFPRATEPLRAPPTVKCHPAVKLRHQSYGEQSLIASATPTM